MTGYTKIFDPPLRPPSHPHRHVADRADTGSYVYDEALVLAVNVALATKRPLLIRGRPGTGKTSVARDVARHLRWRYYTRTISSRTQARDLLWSYDDVARLSAAGSGSAKSRENYVVPGVLWWAFSPATALAAVLAGAEPGSRADPAEYPAGPPPIGSTPAVVLLDELDKADPDVPNDLLEPLGVFRFDGPRTPVDADPVPLTIITTNEERELPRAFLRRCVVHVLRSPTPQRLRDIATVKFGQQDSALYEQLIQSFPPILADQGHGPLEPTVDVSIAEFLDAAAAARELGIRPGHPMWAQVLQATTSKPATLDLR
jgi:MoxR-like ATPase